MSVCYLITTVVIWTLVAFHCCFLIASCVLHFHVLHFSACIFMSCIFMPCNLVLHFHVLHFHVLHFHATRLFLVQRLRVSTIFYTHVYFRLIWASSDEFYRTCSRSVFWQKAVVQSETLFGSAAVVGEPMSADCHDFIPSLLTYSTCYMNATNIHA